MGARWISRSAAAIAALVVWLGMCAGGAFASSVFLCVPSTAGQSVTSGGPSPGTCASGTKVALPASSADQQTLISILPHISFVSTGIGGKPTIRFTGVNAQIINGAGSTASVNGTGNLVLGYDENPAGRAQTGSHDLILGRNQAFTSYGGLVGGYNDAATGPYASVLGEGNTASGTSATVTGGDANAAKAEAASVAGGYKNTAASSFTSVGGGCSNIAGAGTVSINNTCLNTSTYPNSFSFVAGGVGDQALSTDAAALGGYGNAAKQIEATVTGGAVNVATGISSSISGGDAGQAKGDESSISGGFSNQATTQFSAVSGGCGNIAGPGTFLSAPACSDETNYANDFASVSGGEFNLAEGLGASVSGGLDGIASDIDAAISGGCGNAAGPAAPEGGCQTGSESVTGGAFNHASALNSTIVGGNSESLATNNYAQAGHTTFAP
jgi:hypothetical protein